MPAKIVRPFVPGPHSRPTLGCFVALFAALLFCEALNGQSTSGTVLGTVKETSGAVVPGAAVTLTNTGTNAKSSTLTNDTGGYQFVNVEVGSQIGQLPLDAGIQVHEPKILVFNLSSQEDECASAR